MREAYGMLNDQDDKYDNRDDGEYHFSDDEGVSYEIENESTKPASNPAASENWMNKLTRSKRMMIGLGVFLVLVFVVYKMVSPSTETVGTVGDITAAPNTQPMTQQPQQPVTVAQQQPVVAQQPVMPQQQQIVAPVQQASAEAPLQQPVVMQQQQPATISNQPANMAPQQLTENIPVQTNQSGYPTNVPVVGQVPTQQQAIPAEQVNQMQNEYEQRVNEYANQNKMLQDQMQVLSSRVAVMESQLTQIVQAVTSRQSQQNAIVETPQQPVIVDNPRVAYSVQAIIPGRAWLRSDSGEAITVAEGDMVKQLGRVTKIDPYDGVVEISTGSKIISLSYGNNG